MTVFGGTGFLGRRIVRHLTGRGFSARIASRHPKDAGISADIRDESAVQTAIAGAYRVVNAISLYRERGTETFQALHVKAAGQLASQAKLAGVEQFIHVSGSKPIRTRARPISGAGVKRSWRAGCLCQCHHRSPAVMFGDDDAFLNTIVKLLRRLPAYPLFGRGLTQLQPVFVEDVAEAIAQALKFDAPNTRLAALRCTRTGSCGGDSGAAWETPYLGLCAVNPMAFARADPGRSNQSQPN